MDSKDIAGPRAAMDVNEEIPQVDGSLELQRQMKAARRRLMRLNAALALKPLNFASSCACHFKHVMFQFSSRHSCAAIRTSADSPALPAAPNAAASSKYPLDTDETQVIPEPSNSPASSPREALAEVDSLDLQEAPPLKNAVANLEPRAETWPEWWKVPLDSVVSGASSLQFISDVWHSSRTVGSRSVLNCKVLGIAHCVMDFKHYSKAAARSLEAAQGRGQSQQEQERK